MSLSDALRSFSFSLNLLLACLAEVCSPFISLSLFAVTALPSIVFRFDPMRGASGRPLLAAAGGTAVPALELAPLRASLALSELCDDAVGEGGGSVLGKLGVGSCPAMVYPTSRGGFRAMLS